MNGRIFIPLEVLLAVCFLSPRSFADQAQMEVPPSVTQLQIQNIKSVQNAQKGAQAESILDYVRQKFMKPQGVSAPAWSLIQRPTIGDVSSLKPRIQVNSPLSNAAASVVPRWEILQRKENGICSNLPSPVTSAAAALGPSDCPGSAIGFTPDGTGLASVQSNPALGTEQRGYIALENPASLSEPENRNKFSDPVFSLSPTSTALQAFPIRFVKFLIQDPSTPELIRLKVAVGEVEGDIPIPPLPPSCTITAVRNSDPNHSTCTVSVTSSGITTSAALPSHSSSTLTRSGNTWTNTSVSCPTASQTTFTGAVIGPGSPQSVACTNSAIVPALPACHFSVSRISGTSNQCQLTVNSTGGPPPLNYPQVGRQQVGSAWDTQRTVPLVNGAGSLNLTCSADYDTYFSVVMQENNPRIGCSGGDSNGIITIPAVAPTDPINVTARAWTNSHPNWNIQFSWASGNPLHNRYQVAYQTSLTPPASCSSGTIIPLATQGTSTQTSVISIGHNYQKPTAISIRICAANSRDVLSSGAVLTCHATVNNNGVGWAGMHVSTLS